MKTRVWIIAILCSIIFPTLYILIATILAKSLMYPTDIVAVLVGLQLISMIGAFIFYIFYFIKKINFSTFKILKSIVPALLVVFLLTNLTKYFYNLDDLIGEHNINCSVAKFDDLSFQVPCLWRTFVVRLGAEINMWIYPLCILELMYFSFEKYKSWRKKR
jgi:hypothetical protein